MAHQPQSDSETGHTWDPQISAFRSTKSTLAHKTSESSLFVAPHVVILKTCGTTLNLLGLNRILEIAREYCGFTSVYR